MVCNNEGYNCDKNKMYSLNNCEIMKNYFNCENGCSYQNSNDLPSYHLLTNSESPGLCILHQKSELYCSIKAKKDVQRLCYCNKNKNNVQNN